MDAAVDPDGQLHYSVFTAEDDTEEFKARATFVLERANIRQRILKSDHWRISTCIRTDDGAESGLPLTEDTDTEWAFNILAKCPFSKQEFLNVCQYILNRAPMDTKSLQQTLAFLDEAKLPREEAMEWLSRHGVYSDYDVVVCVCIPVMERMNAYLAESDRAA